MSGLFYLKIQPEMARLPMYIVISVILSFTMYGCDSGGYSTTRSYVADVYDAAELSRESFSVNSPSLLFVSKELVSLGLEQDNIPGFIAGDWEFSRNDAILGVGQLYDYPLLESFMIIEQRERVSESSGRIYVQSDFRKFSRVVR